MYNLLEKETLAQRRHRAQNSSKRASTLSCLTVAHTHTHTQATNTFQEMNQRVEKFAYLTYEWGVETCAWTRSSEYPVAGGPTWMNTKRNYGNWETGVLSNIFLQHMLHVCVKKPVFFFFISLGVKPSSVLLLSSSSS